MSERRALVVRGGWDGHAPVAATEVFIPHLEEQGFAVGISEDLDVYLDADRLRETDLIVQCWSIGTITGAQAAGLEAAVRHGTGLAGWHGGIIGAFHHNRYQLLTGGKFVWHPDEFVDHVLTVRPERAQHEIVSGIDSVELHTEKYWVISDPLNDVLATVIFDPEDDAEWSQSITMPAVWTRHWGAGRVFVSTVGHRVDDLLVPEIKRITERGLTWAARYHRAD
ncbi:ThuA domain-containing protein [Catenuloplanes japonicus]|uniref:ThuA domain-containing protein n=1 Tax=Catenuloplanes japonicus TaxID=33876 RepID=UPI0005277EDB|nr:ThuA domain-containing protein [Catenuloplanes japonicus]